jgi:hypothetical protein
MSHFSLICGGETNAPKSKICTITNGHKKFCRDAQSYISLNASRKFSLHELFRYSDRTAKRTHSKITKKDNFLAQH